MAAMIAIGVIALLVTNLEHRKQLRALAGQGPSERSFAAIVSWAVLALGLLGLVLVILRQ
jgi:hypothetical protein